MSSIVPCDHMFSILLGIYLGVEFLGHMVTLCLIIWGTAKLFPQWLHPFTFPPAMHEGCIWYFTNFEISFTPVISLNNNKIVTTIIIIKRVRWVLQGIIFIFIDKEIILVKILSVASNRNSTQTDWSRKGNVQVHVNRKYKGDCCRYGWIKSPKWDTCLFLSVFS